MKTVSNILKLVAAVILVIAGIMSLVGASFGAPDAPYIYSTSHEIYGGDAYTGIQQAAADTANNVKTLLGFMEDLGEMIGNIGKTFMRVLGIAFIGCGILVAAGIKFDAFAKKDVTENAYPAPATLVAPAQPEPTRFCTFCGEPMTSQFCTKCGNCSEDTEYRKEI